MENKHCNDCGTLVQYDGHDCEDYNTDRDDIIICSECGLKSRCFCDGCGEYVTTSECIVEDQNDEGIEITEVLCSQCQEPECTKCGSEFENEIWKTPSTDYEEYICSNEKCCAVHTINIETELDDDGERSGDIERDWDTLDFSYIWEQGLKKDNDEPEDFTGVCPECGSDNLDNVSGGVCETEMACDDCGHKFGIESKGWIIS